MPSSHDIAQALAARAAIAASERRGTESRSLYSQAADLEGEALRNLGGDKPRTFSILAVSWVSLLYKARRYKDAENALYQTLAHPMALPFAREQLRELLEVVFDEQSIPDGYQYSGDELEVTMRGGEVGSGTAPFDLVLATGTDVKNFVTRVTEYHGGFAFRSRGLPPPEVMAAMEMRATQPRIGSYKFSLRVLEPEQLDMYEPPRIRGDDAVQTAVNVMRLANVGTSDAHERLAELVPDADYRRAMLKLLRNLAPSDGRMREIEVTRRSTESDEVQRVTLGPGSVERVRATLQRDQPPAPDLKPIEMVTGVLRALHLDERWLEIARSGESPLKCLTPADVLDDVVGPMVNRKVIVRGRTRQRKKTAFDLTDIELDR